MRYTCQPIKLDIVLAGNLDEFSQRFFAQGFNLLEFISKSGDSLLGCNNKLEHQRVALAAFVNGLNAMM